MVDFRPNHRRVAEQESGCRLWAGTGHNTGLLKRRFDKVYAVEPNQRMHDKLLTACPEAEVISVTIAKSRLSEPVDFGIISHVLYRIPDHEWVGQMLHC